MLEFLSVSLLFLQAVLHSTYCAEPNDQPSLSASRSSRFRGRLESFGLIGRCDEREALAKYKAEFLEKLEKILAQPPRKSPVGSVHMRENTLDANSVDFETAKQTPMIDAAILPTNDDPYAGQNHQSNPSNVLQPGSLDSCQRARYLIENLKEGVHFGLRCNAYVLGIRKNPDLWLGKCARDRLGLSGSAIRILLDF